MQQREIVSKLNELIKNKEKLKAVAYVWNLGKLVKERYTELNFGLRETKESIDLAEGFDRPGKIWLNRLRLNYPLFYKEIQYIKQEEFNKL